MENLQKGSREQESHPFTWWEDKKSGLTKIFLENSSDSEDDLGNKRYVKEKDPNWLKDQ
jgi:hypothetical protein